MRSPVLVALGFLLCLFADPARAEKRVALVIGVSAYQQAAQLPNSSRDAEAMVALFKRAGFDAVMSRRDPGVAELRRTIREFSEISRDADISVVYYAGHGIEVDGVNYLVPADARLVSDFDIEDETISLDRVLRAIDPAKRLRLVLGRESAQAIARGRSLVNGQALEIKSSKVTGTSCAIRSGNVFGQ